VDTLETRPKPGPKPLGFEKVLVGIPPRDVQRITMIAKTYNVSTSAVVRACIRWALAESGLADP
jgi:hypothetical protein